MSEYLADVRSRIEALGMDFQFVKTIRTGMNGVERETWLLEYEGSQFVFVAGQKNVVLGWDVETCPLGEGVMAGLKDDFEAGHEYFEGEMQDLRSDYKEQMEAAKKSGDLEAAEELAEEMAEELKYMEEDIVERGYANWENFIKKWNENLACSLSPLRTADIGDLIVEVDARYIEEDAPSLREAVRSLKTGPFTLATEDEWEYLCNGGTRTLFRWGDSLKEELEEIYNVGAVSRCKEKPLLNRPNMLGLFIAYNSYKIEIIDDLQYMKGGDGGCSLCGADGAVYVLPCYTAFYRQQENESIGELSKNYYCYRRIIRLPE